MLFIGPIALIAMKVGPPELTAIVLLSLIIISATCAGSLVKGLIMGVIGLLFSMIGQDPLGFMQRFTFDIRDNYAIIYYPPLPRAVLEVEGGTYLGSSLRMKDAADCASRP